MGRVLFFTYLLGVAVGCWRTDAALPARVGLALAWPIAAAAFVVTLGLMGLVAVVVFPALGVFTAAVAALLGWWLS